MRNLLSLSYIFDTFLSEQCVSMATIGSHMVSGTFDGSWETTRHPSKKGCREHDRGGGFETFFGL